MTKRKTVTTKEGPGRPRIPISSKSGRTMLRNKGTMFVTTVISEITMLTKMIGSRKANPEFKLACMRERRAAIEGVLPYVLPKLAVLATDTDSELVRELFGALAEKTDDPKEVA